MAATSINNLDELDTVADIDADEEETLKAAVKGAMVLAGADAYRVTDLFIGQMSAEGFDLTAGDGTGVRSYVQSPTIRVSHVIRDGRKPEVQFFEYNSDTSEWDLFGRGVFPAFLHPDYPPRT